MPTTPIHTWSGRKLEPAIYPHLALTIAVRLPASVTLARGTVLGELTATPGTYNAYADAGAGGLGTAKAILAFDVVTDSSGNIILTTTAGATGGEFGEKFLTVPVYVAGYFKTSELVGLDAPGIIDLGGNLISGVLSDGILRIG